MQCPRCDRLLLAVARRPSTWAARADVGTWIGVHLGDVRATSDCRLSEAEALGSATGPIATGGTEAPGDLAPVRRAA